MKNLHITEARCAGTDHKFRPTICPVRDQCQRHMQMNLDRQFGLPPEVTATIKVMTLPRVGENACNFAMKLA